MMEKAIDFGFEGVDTAPLYADSEEKIGIAFKNLQTCLPVSSKMRRKVQNSVEARYSIEKSLENLKIDQLHYLFVHSVPVHSYENYLCAIVTEKNNNLIGKIGYSGDDMNLKNAIELGKFDCVMGTLNILDLNNLDMLREARKKGIQTFVNP